MAILLLLLLLLLLLAIVAPISPAIASRAAFDPSPSPSFSSSPLPALAPHEADALSPPLTWPPLQLSSPSPAPQLHHETESFPSLPPLDAADSPAEIPEDSQETPDHNSTITWCAVRDEFEDCKDYIGLLETGDYQWSCVRKESVKECMDAIKAKKADLITVDAGLAYIAFINYSMKAIMAEEYCYRSKSYKAVAVVPKEFCDKFSELSIKDFRGRRSCHPGYRFAAGWNYPVNFLVQTGIQTPNFADEMNGDESVVRSFFSDTCAPSEFEGTGICTSCGNNGSCDPSLSSIYQGYSGAYRCLVEGVGDIAFLRSDTALQLSSDGMNAQKWSTKAVSDFMYLCPDGGCRPINDNLGNCTFGSVPSNVIMTFNSQPNKKKSAIVKTLLDAGWADAVYSGHNSEDHVFSASTQNLVELKDLTRVYLGEAAIISQNVDSVHYSNVSLVSNKGSYLFCSVFSVYLVMSVLFANLQLFIL